MQQLEGANEPEGDALHIALTGYREQRLFRRGDVVSDLFSGYQLSPDPRTMSSSIAKNSWEQARG